ncbi:MAG: efflux RND transporter permease subunit, partial [Ignavibacteria bacterium]|nr:efflux RND transporter permease subunit [Ignavibacteria bacterium]
MTITELSIKRPSLVIVVFASLIVLGLFAFQQLKYELLPKISPPIITITTVYPGASPNEVETGVTKVIEDAVSGMDKVSEVRSTS